MYPLLHKYFADIFLQDISQNKNIKLTMIWVCVMFMIVLKVLSHSAFALT